MNFGWLVGTAPDAGWFGYANLTSRQFSPGLRLDFWVLDMPPPVGTVRGRDSSGPSIFAPDILAGKNFGGDTCQALRWRLGAASGGVRTLTPAVSPPRGIDRALPSFCGATRSLP